MTTATVSYDQRPWLAHYPEGVEHDIDFEPITMPEFIAEIIDKYPDRPALKFNGFTLNYRRLGDLIDRFATCLNDFGVRKGDAVAILLPNTVPCVIAFQAILKLGAIAVMNNPLYSDRELEHQLNDSGATCLITLDLLANRMIDLRPKTKVKQIVVTSIGDYLPFIKKLLFPLVAKKKGLAATVKAAENVYRWTDVLKNYKPNPPRVALTFDDVAIYQYTGGTTGLSKGAVLTHGNLSKQGQQLDGWYPGYGEDNPQIILAALPFFHVYGLTCIMNLCLSAGWCMVLVPKPQPEQLLEAFAKERPTFAPLVPTMFIGMLQHPDFDQVDMSCVEACFSGSAPLPVEVIKDFTARIGCNVNEGYGLTETSPATHSTPFGGLSKPGSVGVPIPNTHCRIVDLEDGITQMPVGESGEIIISGPQVMRGYLNRDEETDKVIRDGWFYTGDIGYMDEDGYFYIVDRKKDMVLSGGYNVYPREIDEILYEHPKVAEACCIGVPHPSRGEQIKAFVVLAEGETATEEEIITYCRERLAVYKLPTGVEFRNELPKSTVGKILRRELRQQELNG